MSRKGERKRFIHVNGIDAATGRYLVPPLTTGQLAKLAQQEKWDAELLKELVKRADEAEDDLGTRWGFDPQKLSQAGWGVLFARDGEDPEVVEALQPLLARREAQAGPLYRFYRGEESYHAGESAEEYLRTRLGVGRSAVDPRQVPYYLLLVGDPEQIPFDFQQQLDVPHAVGRIHFSTAAEYAAYAQAVVETETAPPKPSRRAAFFGVRNSHDPSTHESCDHLVEPLAASLAGELADWQSRTRCTVRTEWLIPEPVLADDARKGRLQALLCGAQAPDLFLSASHGVGFPSTDPLQLPHQGALLCQEWPGPVRWPDEKPIPPEFYFSADDLRTGAQVRGMIAFFFACFGGGTPRWNDFLHRRDGKPEELTPRPFVARLPQALLARGALAVVAHTDRAWNFSFTWEEAGGQIGPFQDALLQLLVGGRVGAAMEAFSTRYSILATDLTREQYAIDYHHAVPDDDRLGRLWTAHNDAKNYVVLGDPAVRLKVDVTQPPDDDE